MESDGVTKSQSESVVNPPGVNWPECTHALVHFQDEDMSSIVPVKRIDKVEELSVGDSCFVTWSDRKKYLGSLDDCAGEQEKLEDSDASDNESVVTSRERKKRKNTERSLEKKKGEATNDENDGGLGGATCRQKKDKNANKEGPSKKKPKQTESHQKKKQIKKNPKSVQTNKRKKEFDLVVGVAPPRQQVPNSAGISVEREDNSDDNYFSDDLHT